MTLTRVRAVMISALVGLVVGGCGGSSSPSATSASGETTIAAVSTQAVASTSVADEPTTTTTPPTTTVADTTPESTGATTTVDPRPIDPEDQALAQAGELTADAFAPPWKMYAPGGPDPVTTNSCAYRPDGAVTMLTNGAAQSGPTMQLADTGAFDYSTSMAFPDETLAMEYVALVNTDAWSSCFAAQIQKFQSDSGNNYVVNVATRDDPSLGEGGFSSFAQFDITSPEGSVDRSVFIYVYRYGRAVIFETQEYGSLSDADRQKFYDDSYAALLAAYNRVIALP